MKEIGRVAMKVCNTVHDSLETLVTLDNIMWALKTIHHEMTEGVQETCMTRHGFKFVVPLEIDFEVGATLRDCKGWDFTLLELLRIVAEALAFQKYKLQYEDVEIKKTLRHMLVEQKKDMPDYLLAQLKELGGADEIDTNLIAKTAIKKIQESEYK